MPFSLFVLMGKTPKNLFVGLLFSSLCFVCFFLGFGLSFLLVSFPLIILSTIFLFISSTKKQPISDENPSGHLVHNQNIHLEKEVKVKVKESVMRPILETIEENEIAQEGKNVINYCIYKEGLEEEVEDTESEVSDVSESSESFEELKWQNLPISESSFSEDEEEEDDNLIEISLPGSESSGLEDEIPKPNLPDFLPESIFSQKGFLELLADINEMNEEDNLIEIDISVGSIKCSRLEIGMT